MLLCSLLPAALPQVGFQRHQVRVDGPQRGNIRVKTLPDYPLTHLCQVGVEAAGLLERNLDCVVRFPLYYPVRERRHADQRLRRNCRRSAQRLCLWLSLPGLGKHRATYYNIGMYETPPRPH